MDLQEMIQASKACHKSMNSRKNSQLNSCQIIYLPKIITKNNQFDYKNQSTRKKPSASN